MDAGVLAGPSEPEAANHEQGRANHGTKKTLLGRGESTPLDDQPGVVLRERDSHVCSDRSADTDANEDEARLADVEPTGAHEDKRERLENWRDVSNSVLRNAK